MTDFEDTPTDGEREATYDAKLSQATELLGEIMRAPAVRDEVGQIRESFDYIGAVQLGPLVLDGATYHTMSITRAETGDNVSSETTNFSFQGDGMSKMYRTVTYANEYSEWYIVEYDEKEDVTDYEAEKHEARENPELAAEILERIIEIEQFNSIVMGRDEERVTRLADDTPKADELLRLLASAWRAAQEQGAS